VTEEVVAMAVIDGRTWLENLSARRCWELLASVPVGRIGVLNDSAPEIYPVNHFVDGDSIVFRTAAGSKLQGLRRSPSVCYEADAVEVHDLSGWSVLVKGRAVEVRDPDEVRRLVGLPLRYWPLGDKPHLVRVVAHEITGRRIWNRMGGLDAKEGQHVDDPAADGQ
jgi:hypothetical protein